MVGWARVLLARRRVQRLHQAEGLRVVHVTTAAMLLACWHLDMFWFVSAASLVVLRWRIAEGVEWFSGDDWRLRRPGNKVGKRRHTPSLSEG
jgi:hypothetical protein